MWWCPSSHLETRRRQGWWVFDAVFRSLTTTFFGGHTWDFSPIQGEQPLLLGGRWGFLTKFSRGFVDPERSLKLKPNGFSKIRITTSFCSCCRIPGGRSLRLKPLNGDNQMWITDYICLDDTAFEWPCYVETAGNSFGACPVALDVQTAQQKTWCWVQSKSLPQCEALTTMRSAKLLGPAYAPLVEQATALTELRMDVWENISQTWTSHSWVCET